MKRIAIVTRKMITGGVERALIAMLKNMDSRETEIDLYLESLGGELFQEIPSWVNCLQIPTVHSLSDVIRHPLCAGKKLLAMAVLHIKKLMFIEQCRLAAKMLMPVNKHYDVAISYHAPNTVPVFYTIDGIQADKKILWLHGDLDTNGGTTDVAKRYHSQYDRVYAVSQYVRDSFVRIHPYKAQQTAVWYNLVDKDAIYEKAAVGPTFTDNFQGMRILSIGRLDEQKGFDLAILACRGLVSRGFAVRWYICGEGLAREKLQSLIRQFQLEDTFVLLGNQENPYGYLKDCDFYVQPSRTEGYCITAHEARLFAKPTVITDFACAHEQFKNGVTGWIVPIDAKAIEKQIEYCLEHPHEVETVVKQLEQTMSIQADWTMDF